MKEDAQREREEMERKMMELQEQVRLSQEALVSDRWNCSLMYLNIIIIIVLPLVPALHQESYVRQIVPSHCLTQSMAMSLAVVRSRG